ncbi:AMED_5909 family protein [Amycolatopsis vastitatis]|uniref:AMED_5909 family protein n=1 Tax=Amycolatopsis vastitatis TaxID=1905142 RepID=UPI003F6C0F53
MDRRPPNDANPSVWLAFRLGNARLYKAVADVDRVITTRRCTGPDTRNGRRVRSRRKFRRRASLRTSPM